MLRNFIGFIAGVLLSYVLIFVGWRVAWLLIVGNADSTGNKGAIVTLMVVQTAIIGPAVSVVAGGIVASIVARSGWWVGGIAILPLIVHGFIRGLLRTEIGFSVLYIVLAFAAAFVISRCKSRLRRTGMPNKSLDASGGSVFLN
jgi:hypothetical protein